MNIPSFIQDFLFQKHPYDKIMVSIGRIIKEHHDNNKLGVVGDQIVIRKTPTNYEVDCNLIMDNGQAMRMGYTLDLSAKEFIPPKINIMLEAHGEVVIEENQW